MKKTYLLNKSALNVRLTRQIILLSMLSVASMSNAQIYKYVDENGNVSYSDTPPLEKQDMRPAELPDIIIQQGVDVPEKPSSNEAETRTLSVSIDSPQQGATILGSQTSFRVSASTSKKLVSGETARLTVNGTPHTTNSQLSWSVTNLIRGEYSLLVEIIDQNGQSIASSDMVTVFVQRNIAR